MLESILHNPSDDAPRLIYADWLEERGDPRGEFIRLQCQRARLTPWDPQYRDFVWREKTLLHRHQQQWQSELPQWDGLGWLGFERGFVEAVEVHDLRELIKRAPALSEAAPIRRLKICTLEEAGSLWQRIPHLPWLEELEFASDHIILGNSYFLDRFAAAPFLTTVKTIKAPGQGLMNDGLNKLADSPYLQDVHTLDLSGNGIDEDGLITLAESSAFYGLTSLNLSAQTEDRDSNDYYEEEPALRYDGLRRLAESSAFAELTELRVAGSKIADEGVEALVNSSYLSHLRVLDLAKNDITSKSLEALAGYETPFRLWRLDLQGNRIGDSGAARLADDASCFSELKELNLSECGLTSAAAVSLSRAPWLPGLRVLALNHNRIDAEGVTALTEAGSLELLKLTLVNNNLEADAAARLAEAPSLHALQVLDLGKNQLRLKGICSLLKTSALASLDALNLRDNGGRAQDIEVEASGEMELASHLRKLDLSNNRLDDRRLEALFGPPRNGAEFTRLCELSLNGVGLGKRGVAALVARSFPSLVSLHLKETRLGPTPIEYLAQAPWLSQLVKLSLADNYIGDFGAEVLAGSEKLSHLQSLDVANCGITSKGLIALLDSPHLANLQSFDVLGNDFDSKTWRRIRQRFPKSN